MTRMMWLAAMAGVSLSSAALAQSDWRDAPDRDSPDAIEVTAPHAWQSDRDSATGAPIETTVTRQLVSYADLDLRTDEDRDLLMRRVARAARRACARLDELSPPNGTEQPSHEDCVSDTMARARGQVDDAIYAAGG